MRAVASPKSTRWTGITLIVVVGLLQLHLPRYLGEAPARSNYATYPGPVLIATMIAALAAAVAIARNRRAGWLLGVAVAAASGVLYVIQELGGMPGLQQTWWEPTRILSLLLAALFVLLASRQLSASRGAHLGHTALIERHKNP